MLYYRRADFARMRRRAWIAFGAATLLAIPSQAVLILYREEMARWPSAALGVSFLAPTFPLVSLAIVAAVAAWLGPAPALIVNLVSAFAGTWFVPTTLTDMLAMAYWGYIVGFCLHLPYKGALFDILRLPIAAHLASTIITIFLFLCGRIISQGQEAMLGIITISTSDLVTWLMGASILGLAMQLVFLVPQWRPPQRNDVVSSYSTSLSTRFILSSSPLIVVSIFLSLVAVSSKAVSLTRRQFINEMRNKADRATEIIQHFYSAGPNLLRIFAEEPSLLDPEARAHTLFLAYRTWPFFRELLLVSPDLQIVEAVGSVTYDEQESAAIIARGLAPEEMTTIVQVRDSGLYYQSTGIIKFPPAAGRSDIKNFGMSVVTPIKDEAGVTHGFLVGRIVMYSNLEIKRALKTLQFENQEGEMGEGSTEEVRPEDGGEEGRADEAGGFIVYKLGVEPTSDYADAGEMVDTLIIAHHDDSFILRPWKIRRRALSENASEPDIYDDLVDDRQMLILVQQVKGTSPPILVVLQLPHAVILEAATIIARPLIFVQILMGVLLLGALFFSSLHLAAPLTELARAANLIAQGELDTSAVAISGEDEVAQLGRAFEQMRVRLQARLHDLSLLLKIAQSVSATLDLEQGIRPLLEGAIEETGAIVAHFVLLSEGEVQRTFTAGRLNGEALADLDRELTRLLIRRRHRLVMRNLRRRCDAGGEEVTLRSIAAFPVHIQGKTTAILWVGADEEEAFDEARINFLSTLAGQATILVENARLFQAAEGERRRLSAILTSTTDAILVTDSELRLLLANPAARRILGLDETAHHRPLADLPIPEPLLSALISAGPNQESQAVEVPLADGRTFYASIAPIAGAEGLTMGKVVVLRDITHFKELDEMKSEFVATVSHDLRAPLTFIRGYATMLDMVGTLNDKQRDYLQHILDGIGQMSSLIEDLLNLRRIEAGVGIRKEPCPLGLVLIEAVDTMRARAASKGVTLRLEPAEGAPIVIGDRTLLRQAVGNLVDNAIKYTPSGGHVRVGLEIHEQEVHIYVSDTGIGIAPEHQVRLFEKFYRIKRREAGHVQGTGLGLALVKSIVERHGGRVWVESVLNQGSTFYIALPIPSDEELQAVSEAQASKG